MTVFTATDEKNCVFSQMFSSYVHCTYLKKKLPPQSIVSRLMFYHVEFNRIKKNPTEYMYSLIGIIESKFTIKTESKYRYDEF